LTETPRPIDYAYTLHTHGDLQGAEQLYLAIIDADPHGADGMDGRNNLLDVYQRQHRWADAERLIRDALRVQPTSGDWGFRLAAELLAQGRYSEGWPHYEARRAMTRNRVVAPNLPFPEWQGEPVSNLLVWPEQGHGDVIQFSRFLPLLRERAASITLVSRPELVRLLQPLADRVVAIGPALTFPTPDAWCFLGSVPWRLSVTLDNLPAPALSAAPRTGAGIGVVTKGRPSHYNDRNRSLSEEAAQELLALPRAVNLDPAVTGAADFQETAEIVAGLERVISVDTAQAHLAASLGKPTAILLPHLHEDWRWLRGRDDSPWYPSARLYRQPSHGDWRSLIAAIRDDLGGA
jgi:hypothetical protein